MQMQSESQSSVLEMVEAQIESLENQLKSKKPGRKHMRSHYGSSLTKFLISAVMRKNYKEFVSWVGRAGRTFWKQVQNGNIESELVDADGNELSASARSKLLKDLQEIAAVMVLVPRLESVCSWIQSNIDHVPAIKLSGLFQQYPPREWGALALVSVPGATAASVGGHGGGDLSAHLSSALTVGGHGGAPGGQLTALVPGSGTDAVAMESLSPRSRAQYGLARDAYNGKLHGVAQVSAETQRSLNVSHAETARRNAESASLTQSNIMRSQSVAHRTMDQTANEFVAIGNDIIQRSHSSSGARQDNSNIDAVEEEGDDEFAPSADSPPAEATQEESSIFNFSSDSEDDFPGDISPLARNGAGGGRGGRGGSNHAGTTTTAPVDRSVAGGGTTAGTATANTTSTSAPTGGNPTAGGGSNENFPGDISPLARNGAGGGRGGRGGSNHAGTTTTAPVDRSVAGGGTTAGTATANTTSTSAPTGGNPTAGGGSNENFPGDISPLARNGAGGGRGGRGGSNHAGTTTTAPVDRSVAGGGTTAGTATANTTSTSTSTPTVTNASRTFAGTATTNPSTSASTLTAPTGTAGGGANRGGNNTNDGTELGATRDYSLALNIANRLYDDDKANGLEHTANATSTARPSPAPGGGRVRSTGHRRSVSWDLVTARRRPSTSYRPVRYDPEEAKRQREEQERREKEILERRSTCITPGCYWDGVVFPDEKLCVKCVHRQHGL